MMNLQEFTSACSQLGQKFTTLDGEKLNPELENRMLKIEVGIERMLHWNNRLKYVELFTDFRNQKIDSNNFADAFSYLHWEIVDKKKDTIEKLETKSNKNKNLEDEFVEISKFLNEKSYSKIGSLLSELLITCYSVTADEEIYNSAPDYYLNEETFPEKAFPIISKLEDLFSYSI